MTTITFKRMLDFDPASPELADRLKHRRYLLNGMTQEEAVQLISQARFGIIGIDAYRGAEQGKPCGKRVREVLERFLAAEITVKHPRPGERRYDAR